MEPPSPTYEAAAPSSPLVALPPELLVQILECLVPEPPEIGETHPVTYDQLMPEEAWYDYTRSRRGLWSLCLTSRLLNSLAQPLLYRVVALLAEEGMVLLFRTLTENPSMGLSTRYLSCHFTLTAESVVRETRRSVARLLQTFRPDPSVAEKHGKYGDVGNALDVMKHCLPRLSTRHGDFDDVPQIMLFYVLIFLKRVETLLLQAPISDDVPEYTAFFTRAMDIGGPRQSGAEGGIRATKCSNTPELPFQHIKTLLLQGDPEMLEELRRDTQAMWEPPDSWGVQAARYWPLYDACPQLTTVEVDLDDGIWHSSMVRYSSLLLAKDVRKTPYLNQIQHLFLHNSVACPRNLYHLLLNAPKLQTLYMTSRHEEKPYVDIHVGHYAAHPEALDHALLKCAKQLRHLDVSWYDCRGHLVLLGDNGRLTNLPKMERLEKLCIQLAVLYGRDLEERQTPLVDLLPPSLVELTLEEWWWDDFETWHKLTNWGSRGKEAFYQAKAEYRVKVMVQLAEFAVSIPNRMPKLKKVSFLAKIPWMWKTEGRSSVKMHTHFDWVEEKFTARGIEFVAAEAEWPCD